MVKQIVAAAVIFLLLVGLGLTEMFVVRDNFSALEKEFTEMAVKIQEETLTEEEYNLIWKDWKNRRETVEFFLNHADFAEMDLALTPLIEEEEGSIIDLEDSFKYVSGTAVVTNTNPSESEITVNFDNLRMSNGSSSYTFKGTATLMFEY